jgi:hypothetical protein
MGPRDEWLKDWFVGVNTGRERAVSRDLLRIFLDFWELEGLNQKSTSTRQRYSGGLHALGGHLVARCTEEDEIEQTALDLLLEAVGLDEGPLIFQDNELWQRELDSTCRRVHRYLKRTG